MLPCAMKTFFGIDCPICGFQRSLMLLLDGELKKSFLMYPPLLPVLALIIIFILRLIKRNIIKPQYFHRYCVLVLAVVTINYVIKLTVLYS